MKTISYILLTIIGIILLYYTWPIFIGVLLVVVILSWYLSHKAKKVYEDLRESAEETTAYQQSPILSTDVLEAEYREKEIE